MASGFAIESVALQAADVAASIVGSFSPLGGVVLAWAAKTAFAVYDLEKSGRGAVEVAQFVGDSAVDLVEQLKVGA